MTRVFAFVAIALVCLATLYLLALAAIFLNSVLSGERASLLHALLEWPFPHQSSSPFLLALYAVRALLCITAGLAVTAGIILGCICAGARISREI